METIFRTGMRRPKSAPTSAGWLTNSIIAGAVLSWLAASALGAAGMWFLLRRTGLL